MVESWHMWQFGHGPRLVSSKEKDLSTDKNVGEPFILPHVLDSSRSKVIIHVEFGEEIKMGADKRIG